MVHPISRESLIPLPDEDILGPAMKACNESERRFVIAMLEIGGGNATESAIMAGYGNSRQAAQVAGSLVQRRPRVQAAIREEADRRLRGSAILAASVLVEIAQDKFHKDRFKAASELLNRSGLMVESVQRHIIEDHRTDSEIEQAILTLAKKHGLDPAKLLGRKVDAIDAEFTEVEQGSAEGLEDILA